MLLLALVLITMLFALGTLTVDWGRVQLAESTLQLAVDAAARHAANSLDKDRSVEASVLAALSDHHVDNRPIPAEAVTIRYFHYDAAANTMVETEVMTANAVEVSVALRGENGLSPLFLPSSTPVTIQAQATATAHAELRRIDVPAKGNPWLAGMPPGTIANPLNPHGNPDYAGTVGSSGSGSPAGLNLTVTPGNGLAFDSMEGGASYDKSLDLEDADGFTNTIFSNRYAAGKVRLEDEHTIDYDGDGKPDHGSPSKWYSTNNHGIENGKSDLAAPATSVVGIFLGPDTPTPGDEPPQLVFDTAAKRDFSELRPQLSQPFFIGDGRDEAGDQQRFIVPEGATRLFIGVMDAYEWGNNQGGFTTVIKEYGKIQTIR